MTRKFSLESFLGEPAGAETKDNLMTAFMWIMIVGASAILGVINLSVEGSIAQALILPAAITVVILSIMRPRISLYLMVLLMASCEQFRGERGWTYAVHYYDNINNFVTAAKGIAVSPAEVHLALIIAGTILQLMLVAPEKRQIIAFGPMMFYGGSIVAFFVYGIMFRAGEMLPGLWETRAIFYMFSLALVVPQIIRTEEHIKTVVWLIIIGLAFRATEVVAAFSSAGWTFGGERGFGNHEDPGLIATLFVFLVALIFFKAYPKQKRALWWLLVPYIIAFVVSDRRTVYAVLGAGLIVFVLMLPASTQRKFMNVAWKMAVVFALYLVVFWNSGSMIATPARSIRMAFAEDPSSAGDSYSSNLYRKVEDYNLAMSYRAKKIGYGYGTPLVFYMPLPISWDMGFFTPHNQILSVFVKTGFGGFVLFIFFYLSALGEIAKCLVSLKNMYLKAVLVLAAAEIMNMLVYSYFDITLIWYRNNIYVGTMLGIASVIKALQQQEPTQPETPKVQFNSEEPTHWILKKEPESVVTV